MRRVFVFLAASALAASALVLTQAPAHAAASDCWPGYTCIYDQDNQNGPPLFSARAVTSGACINVPTSANDRADSWYVNLSRGWYARFYLDAGCNGRQLCREWSGGCGPWPWQSLGNFNNWDTNVLTSIRMTYSP